MLFVELSAGGTLIEPVHTEAVKGYINIRLILGLHVKLQLIQLFVSRELATLSGGLQE